MDQSAVSPPVAQWYGKWETLHATVGIQSWETQSLPMSHGSFLNKLLNFRFDSRDQCWTFCVVCWDDSLYLQTKKEISKRTVHIF